MSSIPRMSGRCSNCSAELKSATTTVPSAAIDAGVSVLLSAADGYLRLLADPGGDRREVFGRIAGGPEEASRVASALSESGLSYESCIHTLDEESEVLDHYCSDKSWSGSAQRHNI